MRPLKINADGSFTVFGLTDLSYRLRAGVYRASEKLYYKGAFDIAPSQGQVVIVLETDGAVPSDKTLFPELVLRR